jgi:actin-related protein
VEGGAEGRESPGPVEPVVDASVEPVVDAGGGDADESDDESMESSSMSSASSASSSSASSPAGAAPARASARTGAGAALAGLLAEETSGPPDVRMGTGARALDVDVPWQLRLAGGRAGAAAAAVAAAGPQCVTLGAERVTLLEALFAPVDVGVTHGGLADAVAEAIAACPAAWRPVLWSHVVLVGGHAVAAGVPARLAAELRARAPSDVAVRVVLAANGAERPPARAAAALGGPECGAGARSGSELHPVVLAPWRALAALGGSVFPRLAITRAQWAEWGPARAAEEHARAVAEVGAQLAAGRV